jgi:hypothetical protein
VKPVTLVGPKEWGLLAKEELQEVTLLQLPLPAGLHNYIAAVTSKGRILIKDVADPLYPTVYQAYAMPGSHLDTQSSCPSQASAQQYGIRASTTADILYVSDRNFCQVLVLKPSWNSSTLKLNLTMTNALSTSITGAVYYTIGLTVAPGITVLLTDCDDGCTLANSTAGASAATLQGLEVNQNDGGGISYGATVFQIKGIPDCRYDGYNGFNFETALHTLCSQPGVHVYANPTTGMPDPTLLACPPGNSCPPVAQWLNVTPLLPLQVTQAYEAKGYGPLPPLLISPPYRGQSLRGNLFEALFVLTDRGVRYINNFVGEYKVQLLEGGTVDNRVRCDRNADAPLAWDLVTDVSEFHVGYGMQHVDMLTNIDCGSIKDMGTRMSLLPYNLEPAPDTWGVRFGGTTPSLTLNNDAVYARLVQRLYDELGYVQHNLACNHVDPVYNDAGEVVPDGRTPPLSASNCSSLDNTWAVGKDKLNKCIDSAFQPKTSFGDQNCNAFLSQVNNFKALLPSTTPEGDVANRVGELWARITVMMHVYDKRFVPSITAVGYCVESNRCTSP